MVKVWWFLLVEGVVVVVYSGVLRFCFDFQVVGRVVVE